jgi:predicted GNAT family N-acyltransferase
VEPALQYRIKHELRAKEVVSEEGYREVLALRAEAYSASGKAAPTTTWGETQAFGDAKVIGVFHGARLVASFMVRFPAEAARLESVDLPLGRYPSRLPPKERSIEVGKLCIHRDFRRTDLIKMLFEQVHRELVLSGREAIVICCEDRLVGLYRRIGFRRTGYDFSRNEIRFNVLTTTQKRFGIYGAHAGPIGWNLFLGDITRDMLKRGEIRPSPFSFLLWSVYGLFWPLAVVLENRRMP